MNFWIDINIFDARVSKQSKKKLVLEKLENFYISIIFTYLELEHTYTHWMETELMGAKLNLPLT